VLYRYALRNMWRDVLLIKAHFVFSVACALFLGTSELLSPSCRSLLLRALGA
jgi:hypothetical protein